MRKVQVWVFGLVILALVAVPVIAQQGNTVWLPLVTRGGNEVTSAENKLTNVGITPAERPAHIPDDWVQHPDGPDGKPAWGPDISKVSPSFEGMRSSDAVVAGPPILLAGPETAGQEIELRDGRLLKLPSNIYVSAYVAHGLCPREQRHDDGTVTYLPPCPTTPYRVLATTDSKDTLILQADGRLIVETENPATLARMASTFAEVVSQIGQAPVMDQRLPALPKEAKSHALP